MAVGGNLTSSGGLGSTSGNVVSSGAAITVYYDTTNDYGVTSALNNGVAWKPYVIRSAGMIFKTSSDSEALRISSSGNVSVGSTAQIQSEKLGVTAGTGNATQYQTISTVGGSTLFVNQQQTTSVSTTATTILNGPQYMNFCLVYGISGANRFADVVLMSVGTGTVNVISSLTASGTPAARTYSQASSTFRLAMASGTYTVQVTCLAMGT